MRRLFLVGVALSLSHPSVAASADPRPAAGRPVIVDALPEAPSLEARLEEIRRLVQAALRYPPLARARGLAGEAQVSFEIGGDREARDVQIAASSGYPSLDRAAERAVREAAALPPVYGRLVIPVTFDLHE